MKNMKNVISYISIIMSDMSVSIIEGFSYTVLALGVLSDQATTFLAVTMGLARELNPLISGVAGSPSHILLDFLVISGVIAVTRLVLWIGENEAPTARYGVLALPVTLGLLRFNLALSNCRFL